MNLPAIQAHPTMISTAARKKRHRRTGSVYAKPFIYADFSPRVQYGPNLYAGYYSQGLGVDPMGEKRITIKAIITEKDPNIQLRSIWGDFVFLDLNDLAAKVEAAIGEDDCLEKLIIMGHSGLPGYFPIDSEGTCLSSIVNEPRLHNIRMDALHRIRKKMCKKDPVLEFRMCYAGGEGSKEISLEIAALMNSTVVVYEGGVTPLGTSPFIGKMKFPGGGLIYQRKKKRIYAPPSSPTNQPSR